MLPFTVIDVATRQGRRHDDLHERRCRQQARRDRRHLVSQSVQRTDLNTQCKLLLLTHAFEKPGLHRRRVPHALLQSASRRGIERLGAKLDGILRSHQRASDGTLRDTCVYSIIASEWPTVKAHLTCQLSKPRER